MSARSIVAGEDDQISQRRNQRHHNKLVLELSDGSAQGEQRRLAAPSR
jgi:hypothetical protein